MLLDLREYLIANIDVLAEDNLFIGKMPTDPINGVVILDNGGPTQYVHDQAKINLLIRNLEYNDGDSIVTSVKNLFRYKYDFTMGNNQIRVSKSQLDGRPMLLGQDERSAHVWSVNLSFFTKDV